MHGLTDTTHDLLAQDFTQEAMERIHSQLSETAADREFILSMRGLSPEERGEMVGWLTLAVAETFVLGQEESIQFRLERLYASLSISIEPYFSSQAITLDDIDTAVTEVADQLHDTGDELLGKKSTIIFENARNLGLNPAKRA